MDLRVYLGKDYAPTSTIGCSGGNIESDKKKRNSCPHRLNKKDPENEIKDVEKHTITNNNGMVMKPRKLKVGS